MTTHPSLTVIDPRLKNFINPDFHIDILDDSCAFSEGPVWSNDGYYLFSDIPSNVVMRITPGTPKSVVLAPSGCTHEHRTHLSEQVGSNGLAYNAKGQLLICQHGNGAIGLWDGQAMEPFLSSFGSSRFNSPNDLTVHPDGSIFFTDPPYGLKDSKLVLSFAQPLSGLYQHQEGGVKLISDAFQYPNGVCLSRDFQTLYCCSNKPSEKFVLLFDAATGASKGVLCTENGDGIKCDQHGNLWLCTKEGIVIVDQTGKRLGVIALPAVPANCCWGGTTGQDLLITARQFILHIPGLLKTNS